MPKISEAAVILIVDPWFGYAAVAAVAEVAAVGVAGIVAEALKTADFCSVPLFGNFEHFYSFLRFLF